jgi:hypothetical protein
MSFKPTHYIGMSKLDSPAKCVYLRQCMTIRTPKALHILVAVMLIWCMLCPFVETAIHWNDTIFQSGFDTESTVAILLLLLELAYGLARLLVVLLPSVLRTLSFIYFDRFAVCTLNFGTVLPAISPPLSLRI